MFKIKDNFFEIKHAYLDAFIKEQNNQLIFGLQIKAISTDDYENVDTSNSFYPEDELFFNAEIILKIKSGEIQNWTDISGKIVEWNDYPEDEEEPHALLYLHEHTQVYNSKIEFKNVNDKIVVIIDALCDLYLNEAFSDHLPLKIETEVDFFGILCGKNSEQNSIKSVQPFLDMRNLKWVQNKYGVSVIVPKDTNMESNLLVLGKY
ncbi:hypothetical protein J0383_04365 [Flavobacterium endoglycinae]|uniref:Uncharacterized protein n=1 Tax=Flavobacterium endoglycinae TaxID=2816357 RepID=A0ABX7QI52_9FLAO|nr:hypothetical protein [Flavobacterium endoglycinae]QSW90056.1 hypothetical protein J0383_04365 [Flavobacterium endoglycinae]